MLDVSRYIGIPYVIGGRSFEGVDCWGLVALFYQQEFGIELPAYYGQPNAAEMAEIFAIVHNTEVTSGRWELVEKGKQQLGDVVDIFFFNVVHVGLYLPKNRILHSMGRTRSVIEDMGRLQWRKSVRGCYRRVV